MAERSVNTYLSNKECPACRSFDHSKKLLAPSCNVQFGTDDFGMQLSINCEICGQYKITDHALRKLESDKTNELRAKLAAWLFHRKIKSEGVLIDHGADANAFAIDKVLSEITLIDTEDVKYALLAWFMKMLKERGGVHEQISVSEIRVNFIAPEIRAHRNSIAWAIKNAMIPEGWISKELDPHLNRYNYSLTSKGLDAYKNRHKDMESEQAKPWLFLCHASEDKTDVEKVYHDLKAANLRPWLDKEDLLPSQNWSEEIPKIIKDSSFILIFFSLTSVAKRGYVQKEFKLALDVYDETPEGQISVIPVRLDNCQIPSRFRNLHYVDLFEKEGFQKILNAVKKETNSYETKPTQNKPFEQTHVKLSQNAKMSRWFSKKKVIIAIWSVFAVIFSGIGTKYLPALACRRNDLKSSLKVETQNLEANNEPIESEEISSGELPYLRKLPVLDKGLYVEYHYNSILFGGINMQMVEFSIRSKTGETAAFKKDKVKKILDTSILNEPFIEFSYKDEFYSISITGAHYTFMYELKKIAKPTMALNTF